MFTGIIEEVGEISNMQHKSSGAVLHISCKKILEGVKHGDSIAVNGVCLTIKDLNTEGFSADIMPATLESTNLWKLMPKSKVNLERALKVSGRLDGHIVQGHIDWVGIIREIKKSDEFFTFHIAAKQELLKYIVLKGSAAIDGISLTVQEVRSEGFGVSIIPATLNSTALGSKKPGDLVNIETDIIGKYVEKFLRPEKCNETMTMEKLISLGY